MTGPVSLDLPKQNPRLKTTAQSSKLATEHSSPSQDYAREGRVRHRVSHRVGQDYARGGGRGRRQLGPGVRVAQTGLEIVACTAERQGLVIGLVVGLAIPCLDRREARVGHRVSHTLPGSQRERERECVFWYRFFWWLGACKENTAPRVAER